MDRRNLEEGFFKIIMAGSAIITVMSLIFILSTVFIKGLPALSIDMIIKTPQGGYYIGREGGILNAILGSLAIGTGATALALAVSLPVVFYLHIYRRKKSKFSKMVRFFLDVLWGVPSIVYGAFGFTVMIFFGLKASLIAGIFTVALLIIPIMARSIDETLRMIPFEMNESCLALGSTRWELAAKVITRQAFPGILTAALISFGRGIGDAASVLFTAGFTDYIPYSLFKPVATLPLAIFFQLGTPFPEVRQRGYASALVLTLLILAVSVVARLMSKKFVRNIIK
ncbi:MAG: phosphate ABC transporter permease PstA [Candidatus Omnitrophica bacterium]|nr:phosphate ABC transporter permease PstA [Candidatus Omnitrophota bacterium]MCM8790548.1 phosphate ABC transporter permease PstA [Candidatus Omnitrophota bacterium]